jgi:membrane protease YdiL (CAAX protease family)
MSWETQLQVPPTQPANYSVPWKPIDNWIGVLLLVLINVGLLALSQLGQRGDIAQSWILILVQLVYLLPVIIIFAWRRINWSSIGFGKFDWSTLGIGCGLLVIGYGIIFVHNLILMALGFNTQGDEISKLFELLENPFWFFLVGAVLAPLVEEIFFRGFLFQGFRAKYGWLTSMLLSSAIFGIAHLDPASLVPTFILGNLLAYLYHRTNSIWPGVILHVLINTVGLALVYFISQNPNLIPS